jgi:hypothetical protein
MTSESQHQEIIVQPRLGSFQLERELEPGPREIEQQFAQPTGFGGMCKFGAAKRSLPAFFSVGHGNAAPVRAANVLLRSSFRTSRTKAGVPQLRKPNR